MAFATVLLSKNERLSVATTVIPTAGFPPIVTLPEIDPVGSLTGAWPKETVAGKRMRVTSRSRRWRQWGILMRNSLSKTVRGCLRRWWVPGFLETDEWSEPPA